MATTYAVEAPRNLLDRASRRRAATAITEIISYQRASEETATTTPDLEVELRDLLWLKLDVNASRLGMSHFGKEKDIEEIKTLVGEHKNSIVLEFLALSNPGHMSESAQASFEQAGLCTYDAYLSAHCNIDSEWPKVTQRTIDSFSHYLSSIHERTDFMAELEDTQRTLASALKDATAQLSTEERTAALEGTFLMSNLIKFAFYREQHA